MFLPDAEKDESVRIMSLDTEEASGGGSKPVTRWGKQAKRFAEEFFDGVEEVVLEFPGDEPVEEAVMKYRGNFGRLLVWVYKDGVDFQEVMIREGYSPYFNKYGNAEFEQHHKRYVQAEKDAQIKGIGVWDQVGVNGGVVRDYAKLTTWWELRARIIDEYRELVKTETGKVYNSRKDYQTLMDMAETGETVTVFTEVREVRRVAGVVGIIGIGAVDKPFSLRIQDVESAEGLDITRLLNNRYIGTENEPRRSYCYVTGKLAMFRGTPQLDISSVIDISDAYASADGVSTEGTREIGSGIPAKEPVERVIGGAETVRIVGVFPNPVGQDRGMEYVTIGNGKKTDVDITGWTLMDSKGRVEFLEGVVKSERTLKWILDGGKVKLGNEWGQVRLRNDEGVEVSVARYDDVKEGVEIEFE